MVCIEVNGGLYTKDATTLLLPIHYSHQPSISLRRLYPQLTVERDPIRQKNHVHWWKFHGDAYPILAKSEHHP